MPNINPPAPGSLLDTIAQTVSIGFEDLAGMVMHMMMALIPIGIFVIMIFAVPNIIRRVFAAFI
jgi:hypothetical protein